MFSCFAISCFDSFESKSGQMEEAGTNGRSQVDKWKCHGQMDKSKHSKPTRVVGRGRDNFDSIVPILIQFFMFCYFDSFYSKAGDLSCISYF